MPRYNLISADNHVIEPPHTYDRVPARLRDKAPKVLPTPDGGEGWSFDGNTPKVSFSPPNKLLSEGGYKFEQVRKGNSDGAAHLRDMAEDGCDAAVIYPMITREAYAFEDRELGVACMQSYNDWLLEEFCAPDPNRLISVCPVPVDDGVDAMMAEAERVAKKGAKAFFLPYYPQRPYYDLYYDPLWQFCAQSGIVASLHHMFGGRRPTPARPLVPGIDPLNLSASSTVKSYFSSIEHLTDMILTGVFQRHPKLKFLHAEVNIGWAAYWMQQMHLTVNRHRMRESTPWYPNMPTYTPEEHVGTNVFFTMLDDYLGFDLARENKQLANAGMYSTDYEHSITLWPKSAEYIEKLTKGMEPALKHKLLAGNCVRVFNLPED
ncbi:MAG TPA: amidohydrolase family protein [Chloroflexota bacterium]|nr:amidohydrolase family protein [Chloroflexota bacterium]